MRNLKIALLAITMPIWALPAFFWVMAVEAMEAIEEWQRERKRKKWWKEREARENA